MNGWVYLSKIPLKGTHVIRFKMIKIAGTIRFGVSGYEFSELSSAHGFHLGSPNLPLSFGFETNANGFNVTQNSLITMEYNRTTHTLTLENTKEYKSQSFT